MGRRKSSTSQQDYLCDFTRFRFESIFILRVISQMLPSHMPIKRVVGRDKKVRLHVQTSYILPETASRRETALLPNHTTRQRSTIKSGVSHGNFEACTVRTLPGYTVLRLRPRANGGNLVKAPPCPPSSPGHFAPCVQRSAPLCAANRSLENTRGPQRPRPLAVPLFRPRSIIPPSELQLSLASHFHQTPFFHHAERKWQPQRPPNSSPKTSNSA